MGYTTHGLGTESKKLFFANQITRSLACGKLSEAMSDKRPV